MEKEIIKTYKLLRKAQNMVVGTNLDNLYFDYLYYQMTPLEEGYQPSLEDLEDLKKSAKAIIKMAKLSKEIKHIFA